MRRVLLVAGVALGLAACSRTAFIEAPVQPVGSTEQPAPVLTTGQRAPAVDVTVDSARLMRDISVLAHDSMEGRLVGSPGSVRAQAFLLRSFEEIGLVALAPGTNGNAPSHAHTFTTTRREQQVSGTNIVGMVRGTVLPDRYIVVTAHYDHLGVRNGQVYNGADDNASGTAGLLQIARHFADRSPRHSIIFVAFDAEEGGLSGARDWVANPPVPRGSIVLNVNMDMIGRNDAGELYVAGTHHYPHLLPIVERVAANAPLRLIPGHDTPSPEKPADDWTRASDHAAFHAAGIPFLYFGVEDHEDYHRPTDTLEGIQPGFYVRAVATVLSAVRLLDAELE